MSVGAVFPGPGAGSRIVSSGAPLVRFADGAEKHVREGIAVASARLTQLGVPVPAFRGRLLRPLVAYAGARGVATAADSQERFWCAVLAVQLAHEASLVHDDVIDAASVRRGQATVVARSGTAVAVVMGDHLLTGAYRAAVLTENLPFVSMFARAVERTVAGERRQAEIPGDVARAGGWRDVVLGKSGELFGCALAAGEVLRGSGDHPAVFELGRRVGLVYQMVDDLLDYCPAADTGKAPLADYRGARWTWPLGEIASLEFGAAEADVLRVMFSGGRDAPARRALERLETEIDTLLRDLSGALGPSVTLQAMLEEWRARAREAVRAEQRRLGQAGALAAAPDTSVAAPPTPAEWVHYLGHHGRSFRFATSFMPAEERERVASVYAWCRYTDDIIDRAAGDEVDVRLDSWLAASKAAYEGECTGVPLLDDVMGRTREAGVSFSYAAELIAGMRMDLRHAPFRTQRELDLYTWRAAGSVGLWLAELYGVREQWALDRAAALGQAMQLTNIVRDVGEDLGRGRLYLPLDRLAAYGLSVERLEAARITGKHPGDGWRGLLEELMAIAERDYAAAAEALSELPPAFRRAATVAGAVYAGIHDAVRRIDYDTLCRRAVTTTSDKLALGARALLGVNAAASPRVARQADGLAARVG